MSVAEMNMNNGELMLRQFNVDMAAFYFEYAAEKFTEDGDKSGALKAYEKVLYCMETDGKTERIGEIKGYIEKLKAS